jgi:glycosyltransferase involved in cell wall biosynthesis
MTISAVILTKNEEKNIEKCLKSLDFVNEIIIIDDFSIDKTIELVHKVLKVHKVYKVFERKLEGDFAGQRNFGLEKASGDWVLFIDADETVSDELKQSIQTVVNNEAFDSKKYDAFYLKRRDFFWGKEMKFGELRKTRQMGLMRLMRKDSGKWLGDVHEVFHTAKNYGRLKGFIDHYPHPTLKEFINDINWYSTLRAKELLYHGTKANLFEIIFYPLIKFKLNYFIYLGFLDGPEGFVYAFMMSFHSFLVRAKLFQYQYIDRP